MRSVGFQSRGSVGVHVADLVLVPQTTRVLELKTCRSDRMIHGEGGAEREIVPSVEKEEGSTGAGRATGFPVSSSTARGDPKGSRR